MGYLDNPRKVKGKVEITFSDSSVSKDVETTESGNSTISHPWEITGVSAIPTVKACTMDGNSIMDGSFQMVDDTCVLGWWSGELSKTDGTFSKETYIECFFLERPIQGWTIIGDSKRGEYPVDFKVTFKKDTTVLGEKIISGNTEMKLALECEYEGATSVRLTITKWSKGKACVKILQFFDSLSETYEGSDLLSFELLEEMAGADGGYAMNSDTASVTIYNKDRKFDKGYLKELMLPGRRITFYIGNNDEFTQVGTYYSDEWKVEEDSQWAKVSCIDKLFSLQQRHYPGLTLQSNVSLYTIAKNIALSGGFKENEISISNALKSIIIPNAYLSKQTVWDALQAVAYAAPARVYIDRDDKLVISVDNDEKENSGIEINTKNMFSFKSTISKTEYANEILVDYCDVSLSEEKEEAATAEVTLAPYETLNLTLNFKDDFTACSVSTDKRDVSISSFKEGISACSFKITNEISITQNVLITVSGNKINTSFKSVTVSDERSIRSSGISEYSYPSSPLIQSALRAKAIGEACLNRMKKGEGVITTKWRGDPGILLGSTYQVKDRFDDTYELVNEYNKMTFDGGLSFESRGRKVGGENGKLD